MAGERRAAIADFDGLTQRFGTEDEADRGMRADGDGDSLRLCGETFCADFKRVDARRQRWEMDFSPRVTGLRKTRGGIFVCECDLRGGNGASGRILNFDEERAAQFLRGNDKRSGVERSKSDKDCDGLSRHPGHASVS